jgi:hypothetical protein
MDKLAALALTVVSLALMAAERPSLAPQNLRPIGDQTLTLTQADHQGRPSLRAAESTPGPEGGRFIILPGGDFGDGVVELKVSGAPAATANSGARGFVGVMVRATADASAGELFYVRPTNGRAEDQERRNHAVQYVSPPDWTWQRMRRETPSRYESYADMEPGRWIPLRLEVAGDKARLYVGGATQPTLIVNDLKRGPAARGPIALWIGPGTIGHFADLSVERK